MLLNPRMGIRPFFENVLLILVVLAETHKKTNEFGVDFYAVWFCGGTSLIKDDAEKNGAFWKKTSSCI